MTKFGQFVTKFLRRGPVIASVRAASRFDRIESLLRINRTRHVKSIVVSAGRSLNTTEGPMSEMVYSRTSHY